MKTGLVPILVTIRKGLKEGQRTAKYPDFDQIPADIRQNLTWPLYIDNCGIGWHYDKVSNLGTGADTGMCGSLVPKDFADAAVTLFPNDVKIVSEAEWEAFWNDRSKVYDDTEHLDTDVLQGILARVQLEQMNLAPDPGNEIRELRRKALDPNEQGNRGIRKNPLKKWKDAKKNLNVRLHGEA